MSPRFAILLDGGFVTKALTSRKVKASRLAGAAISYKDAFPTAEDILQECERIKNLPAFKGHEMLRIYYYDAPPVTGTLTNPIDGSEVDLGNSNVHKRGSALLDSLELLPDFAVRKGETVTRGWVIGSAAFKQMLKSPRVPEARDLKPNIQQKGVDLRIGLDIALLSLRQLCSAIVVVTGDSDLIPAFKFARREGMRVHLDFLGMPIRRELKVHADIVL